MLELSVEKDRIVIKTRDLWNKLRERGKRLKLISIELKEKSIRMK